VNKDRRTGADHISFALLVSNTSARSVQEWTISDRG